MSVIGLIGAGVGLASSLWGAHKGAKAAKKQEDELARQKAANEAWYNRNYYQDYLNTVEAQNALKRVRSAWDERVKGERGRQVVTGGTAQQAQAIAEAGGEAMGDVVGNLAAKGQQNRQAIDAQKLAMDANLSQQQMAIEEQKQQAAADMVSSGASMITSSLQSLNSGPKKADVLGHKGVPMYPDDVKPLGEVAAPGVEVPNNTTAKRPPVGGVPTQDVKSELPDEVLKLDIPAIVAPKPKDVSAGIVAGNGKMAGVNPEIGVPEEDYYTKNKRYY